MKTNSSNFIIEVGSFLLQIILACLVAFVFSRYQINLYYFQWAALGLLGIFLLKGGLKSASQSVWPWQQMMTIATFQLCLIATFYGISHYFGASSFSEVIMYNGFSLGLAPWAVMILVAVMLRLTQQRSQQDTYMTDVLAPLLHLKKGSQSWALIHLSVRQCTNVILAITLVVLSLSVVNALLGPFDYFSASSVIISFIFILLAVFKKPQQLFKHFVSNRKKLFLTLPLLALVIGLLITLLAWLLSSLADTTTKTPALISYLNACFNPRYITILFGQSWWLAWAVAGGVYIAHKSRNLSIRQMIVLSALVPVILTLCFLAPHVQAALITPSWAVIIGFLGCTGVCWHLFQRDTLPTTIISYLPNTATPKSRAHQFHLLKLVKFMLFVLFFAIPIGVQIPAFFSAVTVMPIIEICLVLLITAIQLAIVKSY